MTALPAKLEENGDPYRDDRGRFVVGHPGGPGRPKAIDFRKVVEDAAREEGVDLHERVWAVAQTMFEAAEGGDVAAAKFIVERLCGTLEKGTAVAVQMNQGPRAVNITAETRAALCDMLGDGEVQKILLDDLERRTLGQQT